MATDATFEKIQKIVPHTNADSLEIAIVSNFPCIVKKGEFSVGDIVFYIREDSKLLEYDAFQKWDAEMKAGGIGPNEFPAEFEWQVPLIKYLGTAGRVRACKLRGMISMGILVKPDVICPNIVKFDDDVMNYFNNEIRNEDTGRAYLAKNFGISHWERPISGASLGTTNGRGPLLKGLQPTDEENFQNIPDDMFPWNEEVLVTKKLDGTSCSVSSTPDGDVHVMSRSQDLKLDDDNVWTRATKDVIPLVKALAKHYNETIVIRGEVTGAGINASKANLDCKGDATFNMFSVVFLDEYENISKRIGLYGTEWHFLKVNDVCKQLTGYEIKTVPIEGVAILTRKLLEDIADMPKSNGEGRVINTKSVSLPHFKSKSKDYLLSI